MKTKEYYEKSITRFISLAAGRSFSCVALQHALGICTKRSSVRAVDRFGRAGNYRSVGVTGRTQKIQHLISLETILGI